jgi:DNA-binding transcriptional MerR regulator
MNEEKSPLKNGEAVSRHEEPVEEQIEFALADFDFTEGRPIEPAAQSEQVSATVAAPITDSDEIEMMAASLPNPQIEAGDDLMATLESIPQKMAFKIGEAAEMVGVKQYVLRYWESEFEMLRPRKSKNNQRVYSRRDVETAMMIKKLLYEDRFSIEGARSALRQLKTQVKEERSIKVITQSQESAVSKLRSLVVEIRRIRDIFA